MPLCHFPRCLHKTEESCAVRETLLEGKIAPERYETYLGSWMNVLRGRSTSMSKVKVAQSLLSADP